MPGGGPIPVSRGALFGDFAGDQDVMTRAMEDVPARGSDPVARFTEATAEAQKLLDEYNAYAIGTGFREPGRQPRPQSGRGVVQRGLGGPRLLGRRSGEGGPAQAAPLIRAMGRFARMAASSASSASIAVSS
ncbi:hypothetical protein AB0M95_38770 [Sphaerisporangium sp. NPDC051017]|uniref:hypothetical protein n=1 Tax=Sphaerisporangium sp. NPDC051017 TaxID=3154636 RepID=UPI003421F4F0